MSYLHFESESQNFSCTWFHPNSFPVPETFHEFFLHLLYDFTVVILPHSQPVTLSLLYTKNRREGTCST